MFEPRLRVLADVIFHDMTVESQRDATLDAGLWPRASKLSPAFFVRAAVHIWSNLILPLNAHDLDVI